MNEEDKITFEQAMEKLEAIVEKLEEGDIPLEEEISIYKEGMDLSRICQEKLKNVEEQLTQIITEDGIKEDFSIGEDE